MRIKMSFLLAPGSGRNTHGKFYIGIVDDRCPNGIYGANTPGASGTTKPHTSARDIAGKIRTKVRGEYTEVHPTQINDAAKQTAIDIVRRAIPGASAGPFSWEEDALVIGSTTTSASGGSVKADRPKRFKKVHAWI